MTVYVGGLPFDNSGALQTFPAPDTKPSWAQWVGGFLIDPILECVYIADAGAEGTGIPSNAPRIGGIALTHLGAIYVTQDTTGAFFSANGFRVRSDGALLVSVAAAAATDVFLAGWARTATGAARIGSLGGIAFSMFGLPDAGAGEVKTSATVGGSAATFTRATVASCRLSTGLLKVVASGVPRSHYLSDGTYAGYLAEGARVNLCLQSENFGTTWAAVGTPTRSAGAKTCGDLVLDLIGDDSAAALEGYTQTVTFTGDAVKAVSIFFAQGTSTSSVIRLRDTSANADRILAAITWTAGVPTVTAATGTVLRTELWASGVYRTEIATTAVTAANTNSLQVYPATDAALDVAAVGNFYAGGVQAEDAVFCSTYIPTTTGTVTRNADVLSYVFAGVADATAGTAYAQLSVISSIVNAASTVQAVAFDATPGPLRFTSGQATTTASINDGTTTVTKTGLTDVATGVRKRASSWGTALNVTGDGAAVATGAFDGSMSNTAIAIGCGTGGANNLFGTAKNVCIWTVQLTDAQLRAMTS